MAFRFASFLIMTMVAAVWAAPVYSENFNITVPIRLYKLVQGVGKAQVRCEVLSSSNERIGAKTQWSNHNTNSAGDLVEDLPVKFDAYPGKNPRDAVSYTCSLYLLLSWIQGEPWQVPSTDTASPYLRAKPGTEFRAVVTGPLPPADIQQQGQIKAIPKPLPEKQGVTKTEPLKKPPRLAPERVKPIR